MKFFYPFFLFLALTNSWAHIFPKTCQPLMVKGETIKLKTKNPSIVMIHNLSTIDLWVTHPVTTASANAGWSSRIQSGKWSALALNQNNFEISCIESKPGHEQQVPCEGLLALCQWSKVTYPKDEKGTFWAGEDLPLNSLLAHLGSRGFVMKKESGE